CTQNKHESHCDRGGIAEAGHSLLGSDHTRDDQCDHDEHRHQVDWDDFGGKEYNGHRNDHQGNDGGCCHRVVFCSGAYRSAVTSISIQIYIKSINLVEYMNKKS